MTPRVLPLYRVRVRWGWSTAFFILSVALIASSARGGPSFQVSEVAGYQGCNTAATDGSGNFVVVWSRETSPGGFSTVGRRFDATGTPLGTEFTLYNQAICPEMASDAAGNFILVWTGADASGGGVIGRRFDPAGLPLTAEFQVNTYTTGQQLAPDIAMDASGGFTVVWQGEGDQEDPNYITGGGIFAQRFDDTASPVGGEFHVNTYTTSHQGEPAIAARPDGDFVIVWRGPVAPFSLGILAQRYDLGGVAVGGEFMVEGGDRAYPEVAMGDDGAFLVAWTFQGNSPILRDVEARAYDTSGAPFGFGFDVNEVTGRHVLGKVASDGVRYLIGWTYTDSVGRSRALARRYDADGSALGGEFPLERVPNQDGTNVVRGGPGEFLATWVSLGDQPFDDDVVGRQLRPGRVLGKRCLVKAAATGSRRVVCQGKERTSPNFVIGDPITGGATLRVVTAGATASDQTFSLPAGPRWSAMGTGPDGYRYSDAQGIDGPVRGVFLRRTASRTFQLKATLAGTASGLQVVPPDPGSSIVLALAIGGGDSYCVGLGAGQGGGVVGPNDASTFRVQDASTEGVCP